MSSIKRTAKLIKMESCENSCTSDTVLNCGSAGRQPVGSSANVLFESYTDLDFKVAVFTIINLKSTFHTHESYENRTYWKYDTSSLNNLLLV